MYKFKMSRHLNTADWKGNPQQTQLLHNYLASWLPLLSEWHPACSKVGLTPVVMHGCQTAPTSAEQPPPSHTCHPLCRSSCLHASNEALAPHPSSQLIPPVDTCTARDGKKKPLGRRGRQAFLVAKKAGGQAAGVWSTQEDNRVSKCF